MKHYIYILANHLSEEVKVKAMHHVKGGFTTFFCKNHPSTFLEQV